MITFHCQQSDCDRHARKNENAGIVLEGGKSRKRRKRTRTMPAVNTQVTTQDTPAVATKSAPTTTPGGNGTPPAKESSPYHSCGPHIANVKMMTPSEREEFEASLKSKP